MFDFNILFLFFTRAYFSRNVHKDSSRLAFLWFVSPSKTISRFLPPFDYVQDIVNTDDVKRFTNTILRIKLSNDIALHI